MDLSVTIASYRATWRACGAASWAAWLESRPWRDGGAAVAIRAGAEAAATVADAARAAVTAACTAASYPHFLDVCPERLSADPMRALASAAGYDPAVAGAAADAIDVTRQHLCFALVPPPSRPEPRLIEQARRLVDRVCKDDDPGRLTVILMESPGRPAQPGGADGAIDLSWALPPVDHDDLLQGSEATAWQAYVHVRTAWESGGSPPRASRWDHSHLVRTGVGDDEALEQALSAAAAAELTRFIGSDPAIPRLLSGYAELLERGAGRRDVDRALDALDAAGLAWRPPGERRYRLQPWAARAVLTAGGGSTSPAVRHAFRHLLVPRPLATQVLVQCLDIEARLHATLDDPDTAHQELRDPATRQQLEADLERFRNADPASPRPFYPAAHPASPDAAVDFAGLHALAQLVPGKRDEIHRLRLLRNALAHGHHCGWHAVRELRAAHRTLGGLG
ncbi:MAG TPA: hypothetical protein VF796_11115 [Humisphaera sp.]